jgi:hypothetical protein
VEQRDRWLGHSGGWSEILCLIGIGCSHNYRNPHHNRRLGIAMVKQHVVADAIARMKLRA